MKTVNDSLRKVEAFITDLDKKTPTSLPPEKKVAQPKLRTDTQEESVVYSAEFQRFMAICHKGATS